MDDYYTDEQGNLIYTSDFLRKRKHCCKSSCLHCPYGHTLKTIGLEIQNYKEGYKKNVVDILSESGFSTETKSYAQRLLDENLGEKQRYFDPLELNNKSIKVIFLKGHFVGFIWNKATDFELFLERHFKFQGITKEVVQEALEEKLSID